jgi:hypothetical protein
LKSHDVTHLAIDEDGSDEDGSDEDGSGVVGGPLAVDRDGVPVERVGGEGHEVIVRDDDIPDSDLATVDGIPCTTALRTVIDIAPDVDPAHLELIVRDCLARQLFTVAEARRRLAQPGMATRAGADLLGRVLPA